METSNRSYIYVCAKVFLTRGEVLNMEISSSLNQLLKTAARSFTTLMKQTRAAFRSLRLYSCFLYSATIYLGFLMYKKSYKLDPACFWSSLLDFSVIQQKLNFRIWDSDSGLQWHLYPFDPIRFKYQTPAVFYTSTGIRIRRPLPPGWATSRYPTPHALLYVTDDRSWCNG